ncbi:MAG: hypothetical protein EB015_18300, partial [Methylocystaceae bacterium]|nr:hypothetical protein [Methylocystaceae bacterium]
MSKVFPASLAPYDSDIPEMIKSDSYWRGVRKRLFRDKLTLFCGLILLLMFLLIIFAPFIAPYDPTQGSIVRRLKRLYFPPLSQC